MRFLAVFFSWLFMPLLMPVYCLLFSLYTVSFDNYIADRGSLWGLPSEIKWAVLNLFLIFTLIAPGISILVLKNRKMISSIEMDDRSQRFFPIMLMFFYAIALFLLLFLKTKDTSIPMYIYTLPLSGAIVSLVLFFVNFNFKVSLHSAGCGILFGYLFAYCLNQQYFEFWILLSAAIISGITISSRLFLEKHTMEEVFHGWAISALITFFVNFLH
jgi:hypothetical protein